MRVWISPEGKIHSTAREADHLEMSYQFAVQRYMKEAVVWTDSSRLLLKHGWVRISGTGIQGRRESLLKHKEKITDALVSESLRVGNTARVIIDVTDEEGERGNYYIETTVERFLEDPDRYLGRNPRRGGFSEELQQFRRRPERAVRIRPYHRRPVK